MRNKRTLSVFIFLLALSELIGFRIWAAEEIGGPRISAAYVFIAVVFALAIGSAAGAILFALLARFPSKSRPISITMNPLRLFFLLWAALFLCYSPCFLAFYPGIFNNDMVWQWEMYTYGNYSTHHPILHTVFASSLFELGKRLFGSYNAGLAIHSLVQLLILSGSAAFALRYLAKTGCSRLFFTLTALFFAFYPYLPVMGLSTTKDSIFGPLFLMLFVMLCEMIETKRLYSGKKLAAFFTVLVLAGMFRNNASHGFLLTALALTVWALAGKSRKKQRHTEFRLALLLTAGVLASQLGLAILTDALHAEKGKINEMFSVPCQQLARAYNYHSSEFSEQEKERLFSYIPEENLQGYVYYISDPVKNALDDQKVKEQPLDFAKLWIRTGLRYPREYTEAFLGNTLGVWYLTGDTGSNLPYEFRESFDAEHTFTEESLLPGLKRVYKWFHYTNYQKYLPIVSMVFYTPFFNWMAVFGLFAVIERKRYHLVTLPLFLLCYIFTVLLGPCVPVRYLFNIILCGPVLLAVVTKPGKASCLD